MMHYSSIRTTLAFIGGIVAIIFIWHVIETVSDRESG